VRCHAYSRWLQRFLQPAKKKRDINGLRESRLLGLIRSFHCSEEPTFVGNPDSQDVRASFRFSATPVNLVQAARFTP
jgi:hypothetical protein